MSNFNINENNPVDVVVTYVLTVPIGLAVSVSSHGIKKKTI